MPKPAKNKLRPPPPGGDAQVLVWDPLVRIFHWSLVNCVATAWLTSDSAEAVHHVAGYLAIGLIVLRLTWGFLGTPYARFSQFVSGPAKVWRYLGAIARGREARHIGHNPAGAAMVVILLLMVTGTAATGYMLTIGTGASPGSATFMRPLRMASLS